MNAIKGEANTVNDRRGWDDPLEASLFANAVDRATFDAMRAAVDASLPDFRRWLRTKARLHGHDGGLPWWDLFAPLPIAPGTVSWGDGCDQRHDVVRPVLARAAGDGPAGHGRSGGSTPSRAPASRAARSACRSPATARWCCSTGPGRSTASRPSPTSWATPTTTPNSPI